MEGDQAMAHRRIGIALVLGLEPFPCEAAVTGDPDHCLTKVWRCPGYTICLDAACVHNWKSFTCRACPVYLRYFNGTYVRIVRKVVWPL